MPVIYVFCFPCHAKTSQLPPTTQFMVRTEEGSVLYLYTKFEAEYSFRSKVITESQNFEIGPRD